MPEPIDVQLPVIPDHVPHAALRTICDALGLPAQYVREIRTSYCEVTATLYLHASDGHKVRYGDDAATTTVTIPIR
ncbi:hypothetical protein AB0903_09110 [Streptomyces sp. NPDC048389]|uniref:hypothetical protein n=1 Tax=Streptomyces sp. NPDC048389 TaxID=3154622 RepID=UPI003451348F